MGQCCQTDRNQPELEYETQMKNIQEKQALYKPTFDETAEDFPEISEQLFIVLQKLFNEHDVKKVGTEQLGTANGYLDALQVYEIFEQLGIDIPKDVISGLMLLVDEEKDGKIRFPEFLRIFIKLTDGSMKNGKKIVFTTQKGTKVSHFTYELYSTQFEFFDLKKDGLLTWDEYLSSVRGIRVQLQNLHLLEQYGLPLKPTEDEIKTLKKEFIARANKQNKISFIGYVEITADQEKELKNLPDHVMNVSFDKRQSSIARDFNK